MDKQQLFDDLAKAEGEMNELYHRYETMKKLATQCEIRLEDIPENVECEQLRSLITKQNKLNFRLGILKRAIDEEKTKSGKKKKFVYDPESFNGIKDALTQLCMMALREAYPQLEIEQVVQPSGKAIFGDYQFNAAMQVSKELKNLGIKCAPGEVGKAIASKLPPNKIVDKVEVAPAGFINMWLSKEFCRNLLLEQVSCGIKPPKLEKRLRVIVDFSAPNVAKQMHVGHLRSTIIGDSIARLLEFLGHDVLRINHVGDWGTQFGMLIAHLQDTFPNYLNEMPPIEDLQKFYKESKLRFDTDEEFKKRAYECVVNLQGKEKNHVQGWQLICDISRKEFQSIYDQLDIKITERGESFYQSRMETVVQYLREKGYLEMDDGRLIMFGLEEGNIPFTIVKSDGGFTYDTSDMAAIRQRIEEEKADWIIYVTDMGQSNHFKVLYSCAERCGFYDPSKVRIDHVGFGVVLGEDKKKFKTRSGDTIKLQELLDEGLKRSEETLKSKNRHNVLKPEEFEAAKKAVAYGCIKYADLCHNRVNDYIFSFDKMLDDKGNTAVYMLYAVTRIRSIAANANITSKQLIEAAKTERIPVDHEKEWKLVKSLLRFHDELIKITEDLCLHHLCEYLYDVASAFTEFYDACYCIEKDGKTGEVLKIHMDRLLLCEATALVMEKCFWILGLTPVSRM
uniref:Probable arginine--tRNA ligase, cytoplasmic n=1 Tax=Lygus hesperus TaxID=30085 RepID=A0A146LNN9_LYGHE